MMEDVFFCLCAIAAAIIVRMFILSFSRIRGRSMLPTLCDRDWTLVWRLPARLGHIRRFDVVICHFPERRMKRFPFLRQCFVKRVIGLPGETLEVVGGIVHINGVPLEESFLDPAYTRFLRDRAPVTLGAGEFFVMGDNRDNSSDSRRVGPLKRRDLLGRVVCIFFPLRRTRRVR